MEVVREVPMEHHRGIQIHRIPAEGVGGLIFAIGFSALFLLTVPSFVPVVAACVLGGLVAAVVRTQLAPTPGSQVSAAAPLFVTGAAAALLLSSASGFS